MSRRWIRDWLPLVMSLCFVAIGDKVEPGLATEIGERIEDFRLKDSNGKLHAMSDYAGKTVVIAFWAFKCPISLTNDERLQSIASKYQGRGVAVIAIDSNSNESALEVQRNAANLNLSFPVLLDEEGVVAEKMKATQTPEIFIIDGRGILRYRGALDARKKPGDSGRLAFAEQALDEILAGRSVTVPETQPLGCPIRRKTV